MGAAVAMHRVPPPRRQPIPPPVRPVANRPTKKCHHLATQCRKCNGDIRLSYPLSVTFWKFTCSSCRMPYSIEIVGQRKCLVYDQLGRKTVERIGLTDERSTHYRVRCYACRTVAIVAQEDLGSIQSCRHCRMDFSMIAEQDQVYYETVVHYQGKPVTFRDKVQTLEGYILHKEGMFFLDEDVVTRPEDQLVETLSALENERVVLRDKVASDEMARLRMHAEKMDLSQRLHQQQEKSEALASRVRTLEQRAQTLEAEKRSYADRMTGYGSLVRDLDQKMESGVRLEGRVAMLNRTVRTLNEEKAHLLKKISDHADLSSVMEKSKAKLAEFKKANGAFQITQDKLRRENRLLKERNQGHANLLRDLDRQIERAAKFETMYSDAAAKLKKVMGENHGLANRLVGYTDVVRELERQVAKVARLETLNREMSDTMGRLQEENRSFVGKISNEKGWLQKWEQERQRVSELENANRHALRRVERLVGENRLLNNRLSEQEGRVSALDKQVREMGRATPDSHKLEERVRTLHQENRRLAAKVQEQARMEAHIAELQAEIGLLLQQGAGMRHAGNESSGPKEDWYCEEGEESSISPQEKGCQERRVLGLKGEPTPERIKVALRRRIKKYHPDRVASMGVALRTLAHQKTQEITQAYTQLMRMYARG